MSFAIKLILLTLLFSSCKKSEDVNPKEVLSVYAYSKSGNATLYFAGNETSVKELNKEFKVESNQSDFIVYLKNTTKLPNDSIFLRATYKGVTKQQGMKLTNFIGNISFQLSQF